MITQLKEDPGEIIFLVAVAIVSVVVYLETTTFMQASASVPQFILALIGVSLVLLFVMKFWGDEIESKLGISGTDAGFDLGVSDGEAEEDQMSGMYDLNTVGVIKEMAWITAYVLGIMYIGFFTVTTVFCIGYILLKEKSELKRRIPLAIGWTALIQGMLYLLFVYFLQVSSVWRLGFLP